LDLERGRRALAVHLELDLREAFLEVARALGGDAFALGLPTRACDRSRLAKERPRARASAQAVVAVGEPEHRAEGGIELLAPLELLASRRELLLGHELRALLEERFGGRPLGGAGIGRHPRGRERDGEADRTRREERTTLLRAGGHGSATDHPGVVAPF
jgi:hypothetical protein